MLELRRIGLFTGDTQLDTRLDYMRKLFVRAHIELITLRTDAASEPIDLVIALGGDGTVLRALNAWPGTPVLAVNFGHIGFLTASDREELDKVLVRLLSDDYFIEERLTLSVRHRDRSFRCVNEVVVKGASHMIPVAISINGQLVHAFRGDGIIVGTPTGSTGYLLSTGAPVVTPDVDCIVINPLNEYSFSSRPIVVPGAAQIRLKIEKRSRENDIMLVADGADRVGVDPGDVVEVVASDEPARLVFFEKDYFFRNLKGRLRWGMSHRRGRLPR